MGRRASLSSPGTFVPATHTTMPGMATLAALRASFSPGASYRTYKEVAGGNQRGEKVEELYTTMVDSAWETEGENVG